MFNKESMAAQRSEQTTIAMGVKVEGDFKSDGDVVIEGDVAGSVSTKGHLLVGESAKIHASISAKSAIISGEIKGDVKVDEKLELKSSSTVEGDVTTSVLAIEPGATVNGKVTMGGKKIETKEPTPEPED